MKHTGEILLNRLMAVLLAFVLLMTSFTAPALALDDWSMATINVSWTDASGNLMTMPATAVPGSQQAFWVTVDSHAILNGLSYSAVHPYHAYTFDPPVDTLLTGLMDASAVDGVTCLTINAFENEALADVYYLYVSTQPMPPQAQPVDVPVLYVDQNGSVIAQTSQTCQPDQYTTVYPDAAMVPGYNLTSGAVDVWVDVNGASPNSVTFTCELIPVAVAVDVPVYYVDASGNVLYQAWQNCAPDQNTTVYPDASVVPGYNVLSGAVDVWVDVNGANPNSVTFTCEQIPVAVAVDVPVYYVDASGNVLYQTWQNCAPDQNTTVYPDASVVPGYNVLSGAVDVWVDVNGANPNSVTFTCEQIPVAVAVDVPVYYVDASGNVLYQTWQNCAPDQTTTVYPDASVVPGYNVLSGAVDVWVDVNGANPNSVTFTCEQIPVAVAVDVPVYYVDASGNVLYQAWQNCAPDQTTTVYPDASVVPGYNVVSGAVDVWVDVNGANPNSVTFTCEQIPVAVAVDVPVYYVDASGNVLYQTVQNCAPDQNTTIYPDASVVPGYNVVSGAVDVWVDVNGANPNSVTFTCELIPVAVAVDVPVYYVDASGNVLYQTWQNCAPDQTTTVYPDASVVPGYNVVSGAVDVWVDVNGANPNSVTFTCEQIPVAVAVDVPVYYVDASGNVLYQAWQNCAPDQNTTIYPDASVVPGYNVVSGAVDVWVDVNGANPNSVTFTCEQIPVAVAIDVPVYYKDLGGNLLYQTSQNCQPDQYTTIVVDESILPGYRLVSGSTIDVWVDVNGANPAEAEFSFEMIPVANAVDVHIRYVDGNGVILYETTQTCAPDQTTTIIADANMVPGYRITGAASADVWVDINGANPAEVTFTCEQIPVAVAVDVPVYYVDASGNMLYQTVQNCAPDQTTTVYPDASVVPGYNVVSGAVDVWVDVNGANPNAVTFNCEQIPVAVAVDVPVYYVDASGNVLYQAWQNCAPDQTTTIYPDASVVPGYNVVSGAVDVWVDVNGANPNSVTFTCEQIPVAVAVDVPVYYKDLGGNLLYQTSQTCQPDQYTTIVADESILPGYRLVSGSTIDVWVDVNGANPAEAEFSFEMIPVANAVDVHIRYVDGNGVILYETTQTCAPDQTTTIIADANMVPGYRITGAASADVWVDINGANPAEVTFTCEMIPVAVDVPVYYVDGEGHVLYQTSQTCQPEQYTTVHPDASVVPGYNVTSGAVDVWVDVSGANPTNVTFTCEVAYVEPAKADVTVIYQTENGVVLDAQQVICYENQPNVITPNSAAAQGYEITGQTSYTITVDAAGNPSMNPVIFTYRNQPVQIQVDVIYQTEDGTVIHQTSALCVENQQNTVYPDAALVPEYDLVSVNPVNVTVYPDGSASPDPVVFTVKAQPVDTPIPVGAMIQRIGQITKARTALRSEPRVHKSTEVTRLAEGTYVYLLREEYDDAGETWTRVLVDGQQYYIMSSCLNVLSQRESEAYMAQNFATAVPPMTGEQLDYPNGTPAPTAEPTAVPTETPTPVPTAEPTQAPTLTPVPYVGYALTTQKVALRTGISASDDSILLTLEANELVSVSQPGYDLNSGEPWSVVTTLKGVTGMVPDSALRRINDQEAKYYLDLWEASMATAVPTELVTHTPEPMQIQGFAVAIGDNVHYRNMPSKQSVILGQLMQNDVVYVAGQQYVDGVAWHMCQLSSQWVYIRADMLRMMTADEEWEYVNRPNDTPAPTLVITPQPYNPDGLSSYGYVSSSSVNFRKGPSTSTGRIRTLKQYAFCLVLGSEQVDGTTWYHVNYGGTEGYISGNYFKQMSITELENFLTSDEYLQGISNNNTTNNTQDNTSGSGGIVSAEDQTVDKWVNTGLNVSYAPFDPFATVAPAPDASATIVPVTSTPAVSPTVTPTLQPLPTVNIEYPVDETESGSPWGWIVAIIAVLLLGGGGYVYYRMRESRRQMAQRAAQRRAQAARSEARPYARNNGAQPAQPRTGVYPNQNAQQPQARRPYAPDAPAQQPAQNAQAPVQRQFTSPVTPVQPGYTAQPQQPQSTASASAQPTGYERPAVSQNTSPYRQMPTQQNDYTASYRQTGSQPRVGRRTAYRQQHGDYTASYRAEESSQNKPSGDFADDNE